MEVKMPEKKVTNRTANANNIIKNHMIWSMGAGFIPVPFADFFAVSAIQLDMIRQLSKLYEVDFAQTKGKAFVTALTSSGLAGIGARAIKVIPGIGSVIGGVTLAVLAGASSYALGEVFKKHFETGGTFLDFDPSRLKKYYDEKFEKGKAIAQELKEKQDKKEHDASSVNIVDKLRELAKMKKEGIITDEEFEKMKGKLLEDE